MEMEHPTDRPWSRDLPTLSGVVVGGIMFVTGTMLLFTVIGIPFGLPLFAAGLGWMLTPKDRSTR